MQWNLPFCMVYATNGTEKGDCWLLVPLEFLRKCNTTFDKGESDETIVLCVLAVGVSAVGVGGCEGDECGGEAALALEWKGRYHLLH